MSSPLSAVLLLTALACSSPPEPEQAAVARGPETAGEPLLEVLPLGADALLEVDVARLRKNPVVGTLALAVLRAQSNDFNLMRDAETLIVSAYDLGAGTRQLVIVDGEAAESIGARRLGRNRFAVGPEDLLIRAEATASGQEPSVVSDQALLSIRAEAIPEKAPGASLRVAARLGFDARVEVARRLDVSEVPTRLSVWGDVVDDLAIVAVLTAEDADGARRLAKAALALRDRLAKTAAVGRAGLAQDVLRARVGVDGAQIRIVFWIGPKRLRALVDHWSERFLEESS